MYGGNGTSTERAVSGGSVRAGRTIRGLRTTFIRTLTQTCSITLAAQAADRSVSTCYRWRTEDAAFAAAWDAALGIGYDRLEAALLEHALKTIERAVSDPAAATSDPGSDGAAAAPERTISHADLQFAAGLLARYRSAGEGKKPATRGVTKPAPLPTRAETDAVLRRALDGLARRAIPA
jgi:hypothetical protein